MPSVDEEDLIHRRDRCCIHRISADRPGDVDKDADLGKCLMAGRRVVASWLVDPSSEHPKILVVLSPVPPVAAPVVVTPASVPTVPVIRRYATEIALLTFLFLVLALLWRTS